MCSKTRVSKRHREGRGRRTHRHLSRILDPFDGEQGLEYEDGTIKNFFIGKFVGLEVPAVETLYKAYSCVVRNDDGITRKT